jgi:hypothetical protein
VKIDSREIQPADIARVIEVLGRGFPQRDPQRWQRFLARLGSCRGVGGLPRFGYLLEVDGQTVGALLLICHVATAQTPAMIRATLSAWYVDPPYRSYAPLLASRALSRPDVTYLNVTPARHTWPILEAQGFRRFCDRQFMAVAGIRRGPPGTRIERVATDLIPGADLPAPECDLLLDHARFGCICIACVTDDGREPFVFVRKRKYGCVPYAQLIYCRSVENFARFAAPLGRHLARLGLPAVFLDADRRLAGVAGRFSDTWPKFFKGPRAPRLGDLSYTDSALFGF